MSYEGGADYESALRVVYGLGIVAMIGVAGYTAFLRPGEPEPANSKAFGCYTTKQAAPILLTDEGMSILQKPPLQIGFHLERHKGGIALTADAPIAAEPAAEGYVYSIKPPGVGWYLDFFNEINGRRHGVFDENALTQFTMLARDGTYLAYRKSAPSQCRAPS